MNNHTITFDANEQELVCTNPYTAASNTVQYILAHFNLGENWDGFDSVRAVWYNDEETISTVLDSYGNCFVPVEVLKSVGAVRVNLVGSIVENEVAIDRLTTFPIKAVKVSKEAKIDGSETADVTPSQFEQFASAVSDDADRAETARDAANGYADNASDSASDASSYANSASGYANDASGYANDASGYASDASGYASDASGYANNAASSASAAAGSAASAATDANKAEQASANAGYMFFHIDNNGHVIYERTPNTEVDFYLNNGHLYITAEE